METNDQESKVKFILANTKLTHSTYKDKIAHLLNQNTSPDVENCLSEDVIENVVLITSWQNIMLNRQRHRVYEDCFQGNITNFNYSSLKTACKLYTTTDHDSCITTEKKQIYINLGLSEDDTKACIYAIAFYTGAHSEQTNRFASILINSTNAAVNVSLVDPCKPILYYLTLALSKLPYYWGLTIRMVDLTVEELDDYKKGDIVCWSQFASSKRHVGNTQSINLDNAAFSERNTSFIIYSFTGRHIKSLVSYEYAEKEDEVLFLPLSYFLVLNKDQIKVNNQVKNRIYLRQIELGFTNRNILWVDDNILDPDWENKRHMEKATSQMVNKNIHFIVKTNTDSAIRFLRSPFGKRLVEKNELRIVSDMNRTNEYSPGDAGARLVKRVRDMGYKTKILIFTSSKEEGDAKIKKVCGYIDNNLTVTIQISELETFLQFN